MLSEFETDAVVAILALSQSVTASSRQAQIEQTPQKNAVSLRESLTNQQTQPDELQKKEQQEQQQQQQQHDDRHDRLQFQQRQPQHQNQRNQRGPRAISCKTCHDRKSKCSKDRPACASCAAKNIVCEYAALPEPAAAPSPAPKTPTKRLYSQEYKQTKQRKIGSKDAASLPMLLSLPSPASTAATATTGTMSEPSTPASDSSFCNYHSDALSNPTNSNTTASSTPSASIAPSPVLNYLSHPHQYQQQQFYSYSPSSLLYPLPLFQLPSPFLMRRRIELKHCAVRHEPSTKPVYKCPSVLCVTRAEYKTAGGLKYHLTEEHSEATGVNAGFPAGWYWDDVSVAVSKAVVESRYVCSIEGCKKRYTAMSGLRYHRKTAHLEEKE
ncbi:hypothetical protein HK100_008730 [Physocladia obscura]|uniref:C2H2-type domain-containing protein n=1 Tax=Physocladia obscura TaxID=109957 RepID=A0AAD5T9Z4_9FUNG|nr:hypothetical protein HK100_008730 [Physocladia obscura]